ncbi:hypothetical protein GC088_01820 [Arthrobacter sp. JZ12]|uniref:DUF6541 family protein n=1 Tax=Arthrobacter sp. JZ12 TaxID=2654190 RepID=UPI002B49744F|nr:DUF6541 family protein [Arthrobacter sp. JZ12]WRH23974.1 hypothetical protein GC088_01820 [Arthrobacter sp. JZ12]
MTWLSTLPGFAVSALVLLGPGMLWGALLGLRRLTLLALAGPLSVTAAVVAAELASLAGVRWSLIPLVSVTLAVGLVLWLMRRSYAGSLPERIRTDPGRPLGRSLTAWAVAAVPVGLITLWIFGHPENIAQSHDNIFHLNAVRYIAETGNASSLDLGYLGTRAPVFYPAGWHALVSLVLVTSGLSVPAAINVVNLSIVLGIWSVGCLFLVTRVTGERRSALLGAAVLSGAYSSFPYLLYEFGVVFPFLLSIALLPAVLGLVVQLLRVGAPLRTMTAANLLLLAGVAPGLAFAHPASLVGALGLSLPMVLAAAYRRLRRGSMPAWRTLVPTAAFLLVLGSAWMLLRPSRGGSDNWDELGNVQLALHEVLTQAPLYRPPAYLAAALTLIGAVALIYRRRHLWALFLYCLGAMLFVIGNWKEAPDLRWIVAGVWYNDFFRISAMLPVSGVILASVGAVALVDVLRPAVRRYLASGSGIASGRGRRMSAAAVVVVLAGLALAPLGAVQRGVAEAAAKYQFTEDSQLLTADELALIRRLPETVEPGAAIVGVPLTGASLSYSYAGIPGVILYGEVPPTDAGKVLFNSLDELTSNPEVCPAVEQTGARYVLDFGTRSVHPGERVVEPGLQDLTPENGFELVDSEGAAELYRITGC